MGYAYIYPPIDKSTITLKKCHSDLSLYGTLVLHIMEATIRHYQSSDQPAILAISADTAFFGEPVEALLEDRKLYTDAFALYYTEQEAPFVWVADHEPGLIGFLFGCIDTSAQLKRWRKYIITKVLVNALTGKYKLGRLTGSFASGMLVGGIRGENPRVDLKEYPAHLQIDVMEGYRGMGVGKGLIEAYLQQLEQMGIRGVHLETTSHNQAACHLYAKVGFQLVDSRPNRYWSRMLSRAVDNRCYGLKLR